MILKSLWYKYRRINANNLVKCHFQFWSSTSHPNFDNFSLVIKLLDSKPANIIETGSSAWGTDSTRLWDSYVSLNKGSLYSVDISDAASKRLKWQLSKKTKLVVSDSVAYLKRYSGPKLDFVYLDSWDVDLQNPVPSAIHGLNEFTAIYPNLKTGSFILIDDTPELYSKQDYIQYPEIKTFQEKYGLPPGKGALVLANLNDFPGIQLVSQKYSVLLRYE